MHLRRLRGKHKNPSVCKTRGYAGARLRFCLQGVLPAALPPGYTWVEPYEKGGRENTATT